MPVAKHFTERLLCTILQFMEKILLEARKILPLKISETQVIISICVHFREVGDIQACDSFKYMTM